MSDHAPFLSDITYDDVAPGVLVQAKFCIAEFRNTDMPFAMPARLARAVDKRRAEFAAGRLLCSLAQKRLGLDVCDVGVSDARAPIWPADQSGSISHSHGQVAVWLCADPAVSLGLDIEPLAHGTALDAIKKAVVTEGELALVAGDAADLTAIFSAKETLFKALHGQVGRVFGFAAARAILVDATVVQLELVEELAPSLTRGMQFTVDRADTALGLRTMIAVPPLPPRGNPL
ncbi:4'-phosphopantetheinyl transferase family protein [Roseobacteraceae bacterium S113]